MGNDRSVVDRIKSVVQKDQAEARGLAEQADRNDVRTWERVSDIPRKVRRAVRKYRQRGAGRTL
jgi:hypothetical protein